MQSKLLLATKKGRIFKKVLTAKIFRDIIKKSVFSEHFFEEIDF